MGALRKLALAAALLAAGPAHADGVADWRGFVAEASARFGVPVAWIERVMRAESAGRTALGGRPIVSRAGAMGLMQLMPRTWAEMRAVLGLGSDPFDSHDNIVAGTAYLRAMYDRFGYPGLFAAYNAGPARYGDYLAGKRALPGETRAYVLTVTDAIDRPATFAARRAPSLFVTLARSESPPAADQPSAPLADGLFAIPDRK